MADAPRILIVGGGIAGMSLATALHRAGIGSEIVELNADWSVVGFGISIQGPALRALKSLGLIDRVIGKGFGYSYFEACDVDGNVTGTVDLPSLNGPEYPATVGIMREALHSALKEAVAEAGVPVRLGVTVDALEQTGDAVDVRLSDGSTGRYGLVVGADGAYSRIRELLLGPGREPPYTGQAVWRAVVPRPADVLCRHSYYGPRHKAGFNPVSATRMYIYLVQTLPQWTRIPDDKLPDVMRGLLAEFGGPLGRAREEIVDPAQVICRPIVSQILPLPWHRGRVLLIGDAAHTTTPQMASGAALALEDAVVLGELLAGGCPVPEVLEAFEQRRFERCRTTVESSHQLGEWEKTPDAADADPVGLFDRAIKVLAAPI